MFVRVCTFMSVFTDIATLTGSIQWEETQREIFCLLFSLKLSEWYAQMKTDALQSRNIKGQTPFEA